MNSIRAAWLRIHSGLFPFLEEHLRGELTPKLRQVVCVLEVLHIEDFTVPAWHQWMGRRRADRDAIARTFVAKAVLDLPTTEALVDLLQRDCVLRDICGWEYAGKVPSSSTFSRAFAEFTQQGLGNAVLEAMVREHVGEAVVHHVSRDSMAINVRERVAKKSKSTGQDEALENPQALEKPKEKPKENTKKKRGRPKKGEVRKAPDLTRLQKQVGQTAEEALAELPTAIDFGCKTDANGKTSFWKGVKVHVDWADGSIPLNAVTTSASMHDSQAAIPMMKQTSQRAISLYDEMDSAYDANLIHQVSRGLGHVPIIDIHPRRTTAAPFDPPTVERYKNRTAAERGNARLKDEFGGRHVRVRGPKVHTHLMFGLLALFADQMLKLFT
jgi:hypothetical protein